MKATSIWHICFLGFSSASLAVLAGIEALFLYLNLASGRWHIAALDGMIVWVCCQVSLEHWGAFKWGLSKIFEQK